MTMVTTRRTCPSRLRARRASGNFCDLITKQARFLVTTQTLGSQHRMEDQVHHSEAITCQSGRRRHRRLVALIATSAALLSIAAPASASADSFASISAGATWACAVTTSGEGHCWGDDSQGQTDVPTGKTWADINAGTFATSCGVTTSGEGLCWGNDNWGNSSVPAGYTWRSISAGYRHSCGVTTSGDGLCWGSTSSGRATVPAGYAWASISAGWAHSCGVTTGGSVLCWGYNSSGDLTVPTGNTWSSVSVGGYTHTCGLTTSGDGVCWGNNASGQATVPTGKTWSSVSVGHYHSCGVTTSGEGLCWGNDDFGRADVPTGKTWASISAGRDFSCGLTTSEQALCWGDNGQGELNVPSLVVALPPAVPTITGVPTGPTTSTSASIAFTGDAGSTFTCSVDGGAYAACASPVSLSGLSVGAHSFAVKASNAGGQTSDAATATWTVSAPPILSPTVLTPAAGTKTVSKATLNGKATWVMKLGLLFSTGGDTRSAAQFLTVQVAVDAAGRPVSTRPSDSQPLPTAATFAQGVVAWDASGEVGRQSLDIPVWVRVGNRAGKWTGWVKLTP